MHDFEVGMLVRSTIDFSSTVWRIADLFEEDGVAMAGLVNVARDEDTVVDYVENLEAVVDW